MSEPAWLTKTLNDLKGMDKANSAPILLSGHDPKALLELVQVMVADLLCEAPVNGKACESCPACTMRQASNHPDCRWVFPQALAVEKGMPVEIKSGRKPSEQILVDDVRAMQGFFNTASSRGSERFAVLYPFEALNIASGNSLLKVLEEPPNGLRFIMIGHKAENLLPTIRSRCQHMHAPAPTVQQSSEWLSTQNVDQPEVALSLCGLDPFEALDLIRQRPEEIELRKKWVLWMASPEQQGQLPAGLEKMGFPTILDLSLRLSSDLARVLTGNEPVQFLWLKPRLLWAKRIEIARVSDLYAALLAEQRHAHHPLNPRLALEFVAQKWQTLSK